MLVRSHAETGNDAKAATATHSSIGDAQTAAGTGPLGRAISAPAQEGCNRALTRSNTGRFGMLWLTALSFALGKQAQAADPAVTLLDDGNITYKDLEHGSFELVTKDAIPRHILVDDPGQTIILRSQGSSISVTQSTNSAARMAELHAIQQDALATYKLGRGSTGSSTPPRFEQLPVQPINFIETDGPAALEELPALAPMIFTSPPDVIIAKLPPPPPTPPTLNAALGPTEIDTSVFDTFAATSGAFLASSPNGDAILTFGIAGGTGGSSVIEGATYDVSKTGPYGTLYVNSTTGAYTFVPDNHAINALTEPTTTEFTITVSDGTLSAEQAFTISINGTNDAAIVSGATSGTAIEASGVANTPLGTPSATGTLTSTDVDDTPNTFTAVSTPTASARGFGTFTMTAAGVWAYMIDEANSAVQALNIGDTLTDSFTVTTIDGTPQVVTITIHGSNDAAVISGATTGSVTEDSGAKCGKPTVTGTLTATDVDNIAGFSEVSCAMVSDAGYGTFTMTADGVWTYRLDDNNCEVQALNDGETLTDTFTVTTTDGTEQVITITIHGANDADPHDYDHLATGKSVICDPPHVFGTPRGDTIASDSHHGQIIYAGAGNDAIHGTCKADLIYAGSGDDKIRGRDGNDKIYGGSGNDTINGNDGCDTIIGGHGADKLAGGYGEDRFVFLSAADSRAGRFDVITDFRSGSDKIDLTALGTLAFMALTSGSTSVPANTIAWFHDSVANETIVYVNPTDRSLDIGDYALLEIHLEESVTLYASDFMPAPAAIAIAVEPLDPALTETEEAQATAVATGATEASLGSTDSDDEKDADRESSAIRTVWRDDNFDSSRLDDGRAGSSGADDTAASAANGSSAEPQHAQVTAPTENTVALDTSSMLATSIKWNSEDHKSSNWKDAGGADDDHAWEGGGYSHRWNSERDHASKHEGSELAPESTAFCCAASHMHGKDSFHFKDKISASQAPDNAATDHSWTAAAWYSNALSNSDTKQTNEMSSSLHHDSNSGNSSHHGPDHFTPDHAWGQARVHVALDLVV